MGSKRWKETYNNDRKSTKMIILVSALLLTIAVIIASSLFLNIVEANHNTTPIISTRNHFEPYFGNLNYFAHSRTDYDKTSDIPQCSPSRELVIYVHGWDNDKEEAIDKFNIVKKSLSSLGFTQPMIGFTWDSDINWYAAKNAATQNGDKLAQFVLHYKEECPNAEIRLVGHSLGTRIILNTLDSLYNNQLWTERGYKITSVHVMGAAVNPAELSVSSLYFGRPIENVTLSFGNKFSPEDDVLEEVYYELENHRALGEAGAENMGIYLPSNYDEEDVSTQISRDSDGDGDNDFPHLGDHHSGYIGIVRNGNVTSDGAMDRVVSDWH